MMMQHVCTHLMLSHVKQFLLPVVVVLSVSPESHYGGVITSVWIHFIKDCSPFPALYRHVMENQRRTSRHIERQTHRGAGHY